MAGRRKRGGFKPGGDKPKGPAAPVEIVARATKDVQRWERERALQNAEIAYVTDERMRPLEFWWEATCAELMSLRAFNTRAARGKWRARRDEYREQVKQEAFKHHKMRAVATCVNELEELQGLRMAGFDAVKPYRHERTGKLVYPVPPRSLEGMINALVRLDMRVADKRDEVLGMIDPEIVQDTAEAHGAHFSPEDMRVVSRILLQRKRAAQLRRLEAHKKNQDRRLPGDVIDVDAEDGDGSTEDEAGEA